MIETAYLYRTIKNGVVTYNKAIFVDIVQPFIRTHELISRDISRIIKLTANEYLPPSKDNK